MKTFEHFLFHQAFLYGNQVQGKVAAFLFTITKLKNLKGYFVGGVSGGSDDAKKKLEEQIQKALDRLDTISKMLNIQYTVPINPLVEFLEKNEQTKITDNKE